jgi:hypothetical protein
VILINLEENLRRGPKRKTLKIVNKTPMWVQGNFTPSIH